MRVSSSSSSSSSSPVIQFLLLLLCLGASTTFLVVKAEEPDMDEVIPVPPVNETVDNTDEGVIRVPIVNATSIEGCPCIDASSIISPLTKRKCTSPNGENGVKFSIGGACLPYSFGSSQCLQHDLLHDPSCSLDNISKAPVEAFCFRPWCYVDAKACMKDSYERIYRSDYFSFDSGIDLFYSYSTCNSTADDWHIAYDEGNPTDDILNGISILANIPSYNSPMMYKKDPFSGEIITTAGDDYYDNSLPYEGVYINYIKKLLKLSNGDIKNITYTHRSKSSGIVHPSSSFTAAVQDVEDGLVHMAVGPFWITGQRLKMTAFTTPIIYDKTFLVIPRPGSNDKLLDQVVKVLAPFSRELWILLLFIILVAALLSVWFADRSELPDTTSDRRLSLGRMKNPLRVKRRKKVYARLALDAFLEKGTNFVSAGVDNDPAGSLPNKFLMFGFGFFILITVSAYVANLAAFLTKNVSSIQSMEGAVASGWTICAHPALKSELQVKWPNANFYFTETGKEFHGILEDYNLGRCDVMAVGWEDTSMDLAFREQICEMDLVYTDSLIIETPIAFPVRPELAPGFSYWIYQGERFHDLSIVGEQEKYTEDYGWESCNVKLSEEVDEPSDEFAKITVKMMFLPLMLFLSCSVLAVIMQILYHCQSKDGRHSLVGRGSTLDVMSIKHAEKKVRASAGVRSLETATTKRRIRIHRTTKDRASSKDEDDEDDDLTLSYDFEKSAKEYDPL